MSDSSGSGDKPPAPLRADDATSNDCEQGVGPYGWILRDPAVVRVTRGCEWYAHRAKMVLLLLAVVVSAVVLVQLGLVVALVFYARAVARGLADMRTAPVPFPRCLP